jgi:hypothetical protein
MNDFASLGTAERGWLGIGPRKSIPPLGTTDLYPVLGVELRPTQRLGPTMFRMLPPSSQSFFRSELNDRYSLPILSLKRLETDKAGHLLGQLAHLCGHFVIDRFMLQPKSRSVMPLYEGLRAQKRRRT